MPELERIVLTDDGKYVDQDGIVLSVREVDIPWLISLEDGEPELPIGTVAPPQADSYFFLTEHGETFAVQFYRIQERHDEKWKERQAKRAQNRLDDAIRFRQGHLYLYRLTTGMNLSQEYHDATILTIEPLSKRIKIGKRNYHWAYRILATPGKIYGETSIASMICPAFRPLLFSGKRLDIHAACKSLPYHEKEDGTPYTTAEEVEKYHEQITIQGITVPWPEGHPNHPKQHYDNSGNRICGPDCNHNHFETGIHYSANGVIQPLSFHLKGHPKDEEMLKDVLNRLW